MPLLRMNSTHTDRYPHPSADAALRELVALPSGPGSGRQDLVEITRRPGAGRRDPVEMSSWPETKRWDLVEMSSRPEADRQDLVETPSRRNGASRGVITGIVLGAGLWAAILWAARMIKL